MPAFDIGVHLSLLDGKQQAKLDEIKIVAAIVFFFLLIIYGFVLCIKYRRKTSLTRYLSQNDLEGEDDDEDEGEE